jgi:signal transduction histidine kinase
MSLITLDQYLKMHHHDTINTLEVARVYIKMGDPKKLKAASDYLQHQKYMETSLKLIAQSQNIGSYSRNHNLSNMLNIALTRLDGLDGSIKTEVDVDSELEVKTESSLLYRYMFNIIGNARTFSKYNEHNDPNKAVVKIYSEKDKGVSQLSISDNGCGMNPDQIKKITEYGFSTKGTTGIGLAFLDVVLPMINMSYDIQSKPNKGTTFRLNFYDS